MKRCLRLVPALSLCVAVTCTTAAENTVRFDFETGDLQGWLVVEGRFDRLVSDRAEYHNRYGADNRYNKQGKYYLSTVEQQPGQPSNDRMTGIVESPVFTLSAPEMSFLVGGGNAENVYVALCTLDGKEVLKARGKQTEIMERVQWQAPELVGKSVYLRIVDHSESGWGHVTFDDFSAKGTLDAEATKTHFAGVEARLARQALEARMKDLSLTSLRLAIEDLSRTFPDAYGKREYLRRLDVFEEQIAELLATGSSERAAELNKTIAAFRREALMANPLVSGQPHRLCRAAAVRGHLSRHRHALSGRRSDRGQVSPRRRAQDFSIWPRVRRRRSSKRRTARSAARASTSTARRSSSPCAARPRRTSTSSRSTPTAAGCGN